MEWTILMAGSDLGLAISLFAGACAHKSEGASVKKWTASHDRHHFRFGRSECIFWFYIAINLFASVVVILSWARDLDTFLPGVTYTFDADEFVCRASKKKAHEEASNGIDMTTAK